MNSFIGEICFFPYLFEPSGWIECRGQILPIKHNEKLFSLIGTQFGGNGISNFALPKIEAIKAQQRDIKAFICLIGTFPTKNDIL